MNINVFNSTKKGKTMATKSILKNITIKDKKTARNIAEALVDSKIARYKDKEISKESKEINGVDIRDFFESINDTDA